jgi:hypothetical protein
MIGRDGIMTQDNKPETQGQKFEQFCCPEQREIELHQKSDSWLKKQTNVI